MKIDPVKAVLPNLLALIKDANPGSTLTDTQVTFGTPTVYTDASGVSNSKITVTAIKNKGFSGAVTLSYKRLTIDEVYPSMSTNWPVAQSDTPAMVMSRLTTALSTLAAELRINSGSALTLPNAANQQVQVPLAPVTDSKIFLPSTSKMLMLNFVLPIVEVTNSQSGNNLNTLTMLSNPTAVADYRLTITGVIGSTSVANAALTVGALPAGSKLTIINKGTIQGMGGAGAAYNANGGVGGPAIKAFMNFLLDTSAGTVFSGGGGGAGAGQTFTVGLNWLRAAGGGGAGRNVGAVGTGTAIAGLGLQTNNAAAAGTNAAGGVGAKVSSMTDATQYSQGGKGGGPGEAGGNGTASGGTTTATVAVFTGGAAGKAIDLNGFLATITAGNNSTQIKGLVA